MILSGYLMTLFEVTLLYVQNIWGYIFTCNCVASIELHKCNIQIIVMLIFIEYLLVM